MSNPDTPPPLRLALEVTDRELLDRLTQLLSGVPGLVLARPGESRDLVLKSAGPPAENEASLTPRELEVLALLAEGASNKTIARRLNISVHTAKFHVRSVADKLDAIGRTDAVAQA
ncbi:MAG: helix-turn-helix domain-containing protein, partial [Vitreimonas sp.]